MNVRAINGSPRKKWNTATLLEHALEGAASQGAKRNPSIVMIWTKRAAPAALPPRTSGWCNKQDQDECGR